MIDVVRFHSCILIIVFVYSYHRGDADVGGVIKWVHIQLAMTGCSSQYDLNSELWLFLVSSSNEPCTERHSRVSTLPSNRPGCPTRPVSSPSRTRRKLVYFSSMIVLVLIIGVCWMLWRLLRDNHVQPQVHDYSLTSQIASNERSSGKYFGLRVFLNEGQCSVLISQSHRLYQNRPQKLFR